MIVRRAIATAVLGLGFAAFFLWRVDWRAARDEWVDLGAALRSGPHAGGP